MAFLSISKRCDDCESTRKALNDLRDEVARYRGEVEQSLLDYESLYDKVRVNLAKLARRENAPESPVTNDQATPRGSVAMQARLHALRRA